MIADVVDGIQKCNPLRESQLGLKFLGQSPQLHIVLFGSGLFTLVLKLLEGSVEIEKVLTKKVLQIALVLVDVLELSELPEHLGQSQSIIRRLAHGLNPSMQLCAVLECLALRHLLAQPILL